MPSYPHGMQNTSKHMRTAAQPIRPVPAVFAQGDGLLCRERRRCHFRCASPAADGRMCITGRQIGIGSLNEFVAV